MATASRGTYVDGKGWTLTNLVETDLPPVDARGNVSNDAAGGTKIVRQPAGFWPSELTPAIFGVLLVQPERQSALSLIRYINHLTENHQRTDRYEIALWKKLFYPLVCIVMMALALPFA